jgi:hypothetical protein
MTLIILNINFILKLCNTNRFANSTIQENFDKNTIILFIKIMNKIFNFKNNPYENAKGLSK